MTEITYPTHINNVTETSVLQKDKVKASLKEAKNRISRLYDGEITEITKVEYDKIE